MGEVGEEPWRRLEGKRTKEMAQWRKYTWHSGGNGHFTTEEACMVQWKAWQCYIGRSMHSTVESMAMLHWKKHAWYSGRHGNVIMEEACIVQWRAWLWCYGEHPELPTETLKNSPLKPRNPQDAPGWNPAAAPG
jgi:hypothetical protein